MELIGFENYGGIINLEADTEAHIGGALCIDTVVNLAAGATLYIDVVSASGATLNNNGGTLYRISDAQINSSVLTGLSTDAATVITASDTILAALGKLQAQINAL
jgi:hypothetical protein